MYDLSLVITSKPAIPIVPGEGLDTGDIEGEKVMVNKENISLTNRILRCVV